MADAPTGRGPYTADMNGPKLPLTGRQMTSSVHVGGTVRRGMLADAERIADVYVRTTARRARVCSGCRARCDDPRRLPGELAPPPRFAGAARHLGRRYRRRSGRLLLCGAGPDDDATAATGHVDMLFVLPEHAGRGIGARLLAEGVVLSGRAASRKATLWALERNHRTRRFSSAKAGPPPASQAIRPGGPYSIESSARPVASAQD